MFDNLKREYVRAVLSSLPFPSGLFERQLSRWVPLPGEELRWGIEERVNGDETAHYLFVYFTSDLLIGGGVEIEAIGAPFQLTTHDSFRYVDGVWRLESRLTAPEVFSHYRIHPYRRDVRT